MHYQDESWEDRETKSGDVPTRRQEKLPMRLPSLDGTWPGRHPISSKDTSPEKAGSQNPPGESLTRSSSSSSDDNADHSFSHLFDKLRGGFQLNPSLMREEADRAFPLARKPGPAPFSHPIEEQSFARRRLTALSGNPMYDRGLDFTSNAQDEKEDKERQLELAAKKAKMQEDIIDMYKSALPAYESEIEYLRTEKRHMKERYDFILKKNAQLELENERLRRQNQELESHWNNRMTEEPPDLVGDDDRDHHFASSPFAYYQNK